MSPANPFAEMLDDLAAKFQPTESTPESKVDLSEALGWQMGEQRSYTFWDVTVDAQYRGYEDGYTLHCTVFGNVHRAQVFDSKYVEDEAQELAAVAILQAIREGRGAMVEVRR